MRTLVAGLLLCAMPIGASASADPDERAPWEACLYCHGEGGEGAPAGLGGPAVPAIGGRPAPVLLALLEAFRSGARADPNRMMAVVSLLDRDELDAVVRYFAALPPP